MRADIEIIAESKKKVGIFVIAYGRVKKTENCVRSILMNTNPELYDLTLIDNGTEDESVLDYYKTVDFKDKKIVRIEKNEGAVNAVNLAFSSCMNEYFVMITNDVYVTACWLENLLTCMESDKKIGFVTAKSSNVSNSQNVDLGFNSFNEMQEKAKAFNKSDPFKWEERLRLVNVVTLLRREVIERVGMFDRAYIHDFLEDDYSRRVRMAGYKLMLCGDTFVHHDHDFKNLEEKNEEEFSRSLEEGRKTYRDKFYGLDPWDDINNYEESFFKLLEKAEINAETPRILGVDVRCGSPVLEMRNFLNRKNIKVHTCEAFTSSHRYIRDLQFVTDEKVQYGSVTDIRKYWSGEEFDYVILGEPLNTYKNPKKLLHDLIFMTKKQGKILLKLENILDAGLLLRFFGFKEYANQELPVCFSLTDMTRTLAAEGIKKIYAGGMEHGLDEASLKIISDGLERSGICPDVTERMKNLKIKEYHLCIEK